MKNLGLKFTALFLAIVIWMAVATYRRAQEEIILSVPLELRDQPQGMEIVALSSTMVNVRVRGSQALLRTLTPSDVKLVVDVNREWAASGEAKKERVLTVKFEKEMVFTHLKGLQVTDFLPPLVQLTMEKRVKALLHVKPNLDLQLKSGFRIASYHFTPKSVQVEGPESLMRGRKYVETDLVQRRNLEGNLEIATAVRLWHNRVVLLEPKENRFTVSLRVERAPKEESDKNHP